MAVQSPDPHSRKKSTNSFGFFSALHTRHEVHAFTWSGMQAHQKGAGSLEPEWHAVENETQVLETELGSSASVTHVLTC